MHEYVQIVGSLLILIPFLLVQRGRLSPASKRCNLLNLAGSATLAVIAAVGQQWGFLLLEGAWAVVSAASLIRAGAAGERDSGLSTSGRAWRPMTRPPAARPSDGSSLAHPRPRRL